MLEIIRFAEKTNCSDQLGRDLLRLLGTLASFMVAGPNEDGTLKPSDKPVRAEIGYDFAPFSLAFSVHRDGQFLLNGGWIYAGPGAPGDGSFPSLSVTLESVAGSAPLRSWSVHT
jgi:hypothetical protein